MNFIKKYFSNIKLFENINLIYFLFAIIILAYIIPIIIFQSPSGTDVYTHMYNTLRMSGTNSLYDFYDKTFQEESLDYDYPFGFWLFGSIVMKITGIDINYLVNILAILMSLASIWIFYNYARLLLPSNASAILASIFLISMPILSISMLNYSTVRFVTLFLISIIYMSINKENISNSFIAAILVFSLAFTHTGTYMFLIFFSIIYFFLSSLIWKKFDKTMYILIISILIIYVIVVQLFPYVQPQYIDKGRMILDTSDSISHIPGLGFVKEMGTIFYDKILVSNNIVYVFFWSGLIFAIGKVLVFINLKIESSYHNYFIGIPGLNTIKNISHGITTTPFWLGPVHSFLSIIGVFKLNAKGQCLALTLALTSLFPGALQPDTGTGSIREIYYMFLIIPISSSAGFFYIISYINKKPYIMKKKSYAMLLVLIILIPLISAPIIGSLYYMPTISGTKSEKENLLWLKPVGNSLEGVPGFALRERIDLYANKSTPSITSGSETKRYMNDLRNTYFSYGAEYFTTDLYSFNIKYIISSERTLKGLGESQESLRIDSNKQLDKIFSSDNNFSIYDYINPPVSNKNPSPVNFGLEFNEAVPMIKSLGSDYLVSNDFYKVRLKDIAPEMKYIGTNTKNFLEEGSFYDFLRISYGSGDDVTVNGYIIKDINFQSIFMKDNTILYKTFVKDEKTNQNLATLIVKYTFLEKAVKKETIIANDCLDSYRMNILLSSTIFAPIKNFDFNQITFGEEKSKIKKIYPSQDAVVLKDKKFNEIYLNGSDTGLFIKYGNLAPYPSRILYQGSTQYDYGQVSLDSDMYLAPSESIDIIQFFSIGDQLTTKNNLEYYKSVSEEFYSEAKIPLILTGYTYRSGPGGNSLNTYKKFQENHITYTQGVSQKNDNLSSKEVNPMGYVSVYENKNFKNFSVQNQELKRIRDELQVDGVLVQSSLFNLDTIKALSDNNFQFLEAYYVPSPLMEFYREGLRNPKLAYYKSNETGVVLFPVSSPSSSLLRSDYEPEKTLSQWKDTIDSVIENGGMVVFLWKAEDIGDPNYIDKVMDLINYAKSKGLSTTTPDEVATHFKLIHKITTNATKGIDYVVLNSTNHNPEEVKGITYQLELALINNSCPYTVSNGRIPRQDIKEGNCRLFVSFDLKPGEEKEIKIEPTITRKTFDLDLSDLFEGDRSIIIMDNEGNLVDKASVYLDSRWFESDQNGSVKLSIRRGNHTIKVEKPGFVSRQYQINVEGRIYRVFNIFNNDTRMKKNESDEIVLAKQNGSDQNATQGSWINKLSNLIYNNT